MSAKLGNSYCCVNDLRLICFPIMNTNYPDWDQKSLALVFCDFYLTAKIMAPHSHRQMRWWAELVTNERNLEEKVLCLGWKQTSPVTGVRPCTGQWCCCKCGSGALLTHWHGTRTSLPKQNAGLSFCRQKESLFLRIRKTAMSLSFHSVSVHHVIIMVWTEM